MPRTFTFAQIGKRKLELSNLQKVLFPEHHIVKAELVQYYLTIAPTILKHIKGRPLSFVRFPDGIHGQQFYQKNRQDWAPNWIEHVALGEHEKIDYILATEDAAMVWLANLACLELHQMHCRQPHLDKPDYVVYDLDPPEGYVFGDVVELALDLRERLEAIGYHTFVKTTGGKGVHVITPIVPQWTFSEAHDAAAQVAKTFVEAHPTVCTLHVAKNRRDGKVFVDIHRNRTYQTIVCPYSVRGRPKAPVATPLTWDELAACDDPTVFNLHTVPERVARGDVWETMEAFAVELHTKRRRQEAGSRRQKSTSTAPEALKSYAKKRRFDRTAEPPPLATEPASQPATQPPNHPATAVQSGMCVQRHHASRLHYDLRLEKNGTLLSWAVPKGLPPRPGIKRMAVQVEDHPLKYLDWEGVIPKGQYGGGTMWVFVRGKYEVTKDKGKEGFYFRTLSPQLTAEYRMINTRGNEWLMERLDTPQTDWLRAPVDFMLCAEAKPPTSRDTVFDSPDYLYEVKWDGIRAMIALDEGQLTIRSRNQRDITKQFPELNIPDAAFRNISGLFDCEIVCLDDSGRPVFHDVVRRLHHTSEGAIERARTRHPAVCYVFDCLYLDGRPIVNEPLTKRREWMIDSLKKGTPYRVSEVVDEGGALFAAAGQMGLEGIVAKQRNSVYTPGKRGDGWTKIKTRRTVECIILGYTKGEGDRASTFGALHLGHYVGKKLKYLGRVGTGFDEKMMKELFVELKKQKPAKRPFAEKVLMDNVTTWIAPELVCEVRYASLTPEGHLREPVFVRLRPDLDADALG